MTDDREETCVMVEYDGRYPHLCSGNLAVTVEGKRWDFPHGCLRSGGRCSQDSEGSWSARKGSWTVAEWPDNFPNIYKAAVREAVNRDIPKGCCGGCS